MEAFSPPKGLFAPRPEKAVASRPGAAVSEFLVTLQLSFMGWLTVLLISLTVLGLVGTSWVHLGRR
jgi:hypothetical protein